MESFEMACHLVNNPPEYLGSSCKLDRARLAEFEEFCACLDILLEKEEAEVDFFVDEETDLLCADVICYCMTVQGEELAWFDDLLTHVISIGFGAIRRKGHTMLEIAFILENFWH
jgi:hypothetical protein